MNDRRRIEFYAQMAAAERELQSDPAQWAAYVAERDEWLSPHLVSKPERSRMRRLRTPPA